MISNIEYAKLKCLHFAVKLLNNKPTIALFNIGATCSCISHHLFQKISDRADMTRTSLQVNVASRTFLGPIGIVPLICDINDHVFVHNFIICKKLKQPLIVGLDFAQRYKTGIDSDAHGTYLRYKGKWIDTAMKKGNQCQQTIALLETSVAEKWARDE